MIKYGDFLFCNISHQCFSCDLFSNVKRPLPAAYDEYTLQERNPYAPKRAIDIAKGAAANICQSSPPDFLGEMFFDIVLAFSKPQVSVPSCSSLLIMRPFYGNEERLSRLFIQCYLLLHHNTNTKAALMDSYILECRITVSNHRLQNSENSCMVP